MSEKKNKGGRPTKYRPEYCELLISHMESGLSFESFAGAIGVTKQIIYDWLERHPEFLDAKKIADPKCQLFYEKIGRSAMAGKIPNFNTAVWIFNMKNRFGWVDRLEQKHTGEVGIKLEYSLLNEN